MNKSLRRALLTVAAAALAVATVASCSVDGGDSTGDKPVIRVGYQTFPSGDLVVKNGGWLEEALPDYTIKWTKFDSGADVNTAFVAGELDFGALGSSPVARGLSDPLSIDYEVAWILDVAGDNEALVARNGTGITTVEDLRGRKVGTAFASTAHYSVLAALDRVGLSATDVQLIDLQPQASLAAWQRGDIDAVYTWLPTLDEVRKDGTTLVTSRELAAAGKPTLDLAVVARGFAADHPDVVTVWRQAQARALTTIAEDPGAAAKAVAAEAGITPAEAEAQLGQAVFLRPEDVTSAQWLGTDGKPGALANNLQSAAQFLAEQKQIPSAPALADFQDGLYVTGLPDAAAQ
ncbi:taurine ABC transporter substrate-binding protein [Rhodococcus triatomae]|nr:ABC transporter substrate-binding protein [Rhodococcus triatomae BKS 15-14]